MRKQIRYVIRPFQVVILFLIPARIRFWTGHFWYYACAILFSAHYKNRCFVVLVTLALHYGEGPKNIGLVWKCLDVGLGNIEFVTCNYCMSYLLRLLQYCMQKFEVQPHSFESLQCQYECLFSVRSSFTNTTSLLTN